MNKWLCCLVVAGSLLSLDGFAAKERVIRFNNLVRIGYDDNINSSDESVAEESGYITEIAQLTGKFVFSTRTEFLLYWQPEFRYRFSTEPKFISYQDLYARFDHAISQRLFLTLSDRLRYQDREGQIGTGNTAQDQNYLENDLKGALKFALSGLSNISLGGGYMFRTWDDDAYGEDAGNNFDKLTGDASFTRQLFSEKTDGYIGLNYETLEYAGDRGGYDAVAAIIGVDQIFSPKMIAYGRLGYQASTVDSSTGNSSDNSAPYLSAGFDYSASERTSFNGTLGYKMSNSENSQYNAQNEFSFGMGVGHDISAKINLKATLSYFYSYYDSEYSAGGVIPDVVDHYVSLAMRGTYKINRNNFLELGYIYSNRGTDSDSLPDYGRNRIEMGWKLEL